MSNKLSDSLARHQAERAAEQQQAKAARDAVRAACGEDTAAIEVRIKAIESERAALFELRRPIDERLALLHDDSAAARDVLGEIRLRRQGAAPDWGFLLDIGNDGQAVHRAWEAAIQQLGLWSNGYSPETGQRCFQVMLTRNDPDSLRRTLDGIHTLLPHLKPATDGLVRVGILEHDLSAHGSYEMRVAPDLSAAFVGRVGFGMHKAFDSLEAALRHVQDVYWYDEPEASPKAPGRR